MRNRIFNVGWIVSGVAFFVALSIFLILIHIHWYTLTVKVTSGERELQSRAEVQVQVTRLRIPIMFGRTDKNGYATFKLPEGNYDIEVDYHAFGDLISPFKGREHVFLSSNQELHIVILPGAI